MDYYVLKTDTSKLNEYGFDTNNFDGTFKNSNYNEAEIATHPFKIINHEDSAIFKKNSEYLFEMLDYLKSENIKVVICTLPLYKTYLNKRKPTIFHRRDSILEEIKKKYSNVAILNKEADSLQFTVQDFMNENHLNPDGAKKFSALVNATISNFN
jgi:hypothetical protein